MRLIKGDAANLRVSLRTLLACPLRETAPTPRDENMKLTSFSQTGVVACKLCPTLGGAVKETVQMNGWIHVSCAIWMPETSFRDPVRLRGIEGTEMIVRARKNLVCRVCNTKNGACIQCSHKSCVAAFHITCAQKQQVGAAIIHMNTFSKMPCCVRTEAEELCRMHPRGGNSRMPCLSSLGHRACCLGFPGQASCGLVVIGQRNGAGDAATSYASG